MNITQLELMNFRGIKSLELKDDLAFDQKMNIFYGINGTGKTTILNAIAILLSWLISRMTSEKSNGKSIEYNDIFIGSVSASVKIWIENNQRIYSWQVAKNKPGRQYPEIKSDYIGASELGKQLAQDLFSPHFPVIAYYPVTRSVLDIPLRIRKQHDFFTPLSCYDNALSSAADFRAFFEWFREREDIDNEHYRNNEKNSGEDKQLQAVRNAIYSFMDGFSGLTVRRDPPQRMEIKKDGKVLNVNQLSDGEKCLLALVGDLARRLAIANAGNSINPLEGDGIVLIDEIDLHLHPEWQRMIIPRLLKTFPNCQFFITTHSPLVLNQVKPYNLYKIFYKDSTVQFERPSESYGKTSERILKDIMDISETTPDEIAEKYDMIYLKISNNDFSGARQIIDEMRKIGINEPDLLKAETLIRRKELIGV